MVGSIFFSEISLAFAWTSFFVQIIFSVGRFNYQTISRTALKTIFAINL